MCNKVFHLIILFHLDLYDGISQIISGGIKKSLWKHHQNVPKGASKIVTQSHQQNVEHQCGMQQQVFEFQSLHEVLNLLAHLQRSKSVKGFKSNIFSEKNGEGVEGAKKGARTPLLHQERHHWNEKNGPYAAVRFKKKTRR